MEPIEYQRMFELESTHWWYRQLRRVWKLQLDRYLPGWQSLPLLDAGCGTGGNLEVLIGDGSRVGLDRSLEALRRCRRRGNWPLVQADVAQLPFAAASFSGILCLSVLYHQWVADPSRALAEFRRVLRPGGIAILDVPALDFLTSPHDVAVGTARRFTAGGLRQLVEASGLRVVRLTYWNTLLFPAVAIGRRIGGASTGRDFEWGAQRQPLYHGVLDAILRIEYQLLRRWDLPIGVSLSCVARKEE